MGTMIDTSKLRNNVIIISMLLAAIGVLILLGRFMGQASMEKEAVKAGVGEYYTIYTTNTEQAFRWKVQNK